MIINRAIQWCKSLTINRDLTAILFIGLVIFAFLSPYLLTFPTPLIILRGDYGNDLVNEVWPIVKYMVSSIQQSGHIPLWRPYLLAGAPTVGHPIAPIFYPPFFLFLFLPLAFALNLLTFLHLWFFSVGAYFLIRCTARSSIPASAVASIFFGLAALWIAHLGNGHWFLICALAWWPWAIYFLLRYLDTTKFKYIFWLTITLTVLIIVHPSIFVTTILCLTTVTLFHLIANWSGFRKILPWFYGFGLMIVMVIGLSAVHLFPFIELLPYGLSNLERGTYLSLPPQLLLTNFMPSTVIPTEWTIYPGLGLMFFTLYGLFSKENRLNKKVLAVALIGLLLSLGDYTPLYKLLFEWNPSLSMLRVPSRWWLLTLLALSILAASGMDIAIHNLYATSTRGKFFIILCAIPYLAASVFKALFSEKFPFDPIATTVVYIGMIVVLLLVQNVRLKTILMVGLCLAELFYVDYSLIKPSSEQVLYETDPIIERLAAQAKLGERSFAPGGLSNSVLMLNDLRAVEGFDPFRFSAYTQLFKEATRCPLANDTLKEGQTWEEVNKDCLGPSVNRDWLKLLNIRYLVLSEKYAAPAFGKLVTSTSEHRLYELEPGNGYLFGVSRAEPVQASACFGRLRQVKTVEVGLVEGLPEKTISDPIKVTGFEQQNSQLTVSVIVPATGLLVRSESWAPGWRAVIDGKPAPVYRVDCALQGVLVPAGAKTVQFVYDPRGFRLGQWVSLGTVCAILVAFIIYQGTCRSTRHHSFSHQA